MPQTAELISMLNKRTVAPVLNALGFGDYRGRKFRLVSQETYTLNNGDLMWSGGSRTEVFFLRLEDGVWKYADAGHIMQNPLTSGSRTMYGRIPRQAMIVEKSFFCGRDAGFRFIVASDSPIVALLSPAAKELPAHE